MSYGTDHQNKQWFELLMRAETQTKEGQSHGEHKCLFSEYDKDGGDQDCWFNPSPTNCQLCLTGQLAEQINSVHFELKEIKNLLEKGRRF